uniref:hypothetical protein n=1 Tax=Salmonella enterica TaxID=28901 RepID=UPI00398C2C36
SLGDYGVGIGGVHGGISLLKVRHKASYILFWTRMIRLLYALLSPDAEIRRRHPDLTYVKWKHGA